MKLSLPLMALLSASTLASPLLAQDMSSFLNPRALAAELGLGGGAASVRAPLGYTLNAPRIQAPNLIMTDVETIAALAPALSVLAPRSSLTPVPRRSLSRVAPTVVNPVIANSVIGAAPMADVMAEARAAAPTGANVAVISGANTAVVNGQVIHSAAEPASSPRISLWQRIFGL